MTLTTSRIVLQGVTCSAARWVSWGRGKDQSDFSGRARFRLATTTRYTHLVVQNPEEELAMAKMKEARSPDEVELYRPPTARPLPAVPKSPKSPKSRGKNDKIIVVTDPTTAIVASICDAASTVATAYGEYRVEVQRTKQVKQWAKVARAKIKAWAQKSKASHQRKMKALKTQAKKEEADREFRSKTMLRLMARAERLEAAIIKKAGKGASPDMVRELSEPFKSVMETIKVLIKTMA